MSYGGSRGLEKATGPTGIPGQTCPGPDLAPHFLTPRLRCWARVLSVDGKCAVFCMMVSQGYPPSRPTARLLVPGSWQPLGASCYQGLEEGFQAEYVLEERTVLQ